MRGCGGGGCWRGEGEGFFFFGGEGLMKRGSIIVKRRKS